MKSAQNMSGLNERTYPGGDGHSRVLAQNQEISQRTQTP